jgi:cytochrome b subunit of formate dehydrogenase/nitrate/TMAO reductase-like tetraheme cytochrome c subunit
MLRLAVVAAFGVLWGAAYFAASGRTLAGLQTVTPNPAGSVASQTSPGAVDGRPPLLCQGCHEPGKPPPYLAGGRFKTSAQSAFDPSVHAEAIRNGKRGASCLDCHSANGQWDTVFPAADPRSTVNHINVSNTCGKCHESQAGTFHSSIHGRGQERGISIAASCSDCHGSHGVFPATDARSPLSSMNTPDTCATCHQTIRNDFETSSHRAALLRGDARAPTCTTCHTSVSHATAPADLRDFEMRTVHQCAECHAEQAPSYRDTFHGQASALGFKAAATCADCHTPHKNLPASDARASIHETHLVQTCAQCHTNANASFVTFDPHPKPSDPNGSIVLWAVNSFMRVLFAVVFGFFGLHTLLWFQRSVVGLVRGETRRVRDGEQWVVRFDKPSRATHVVLVVSFLVLAATGLPLMFYATGWGQVLASSLGGVTATRVLHRVFAVVTFGYAFYHLGHLLWLALVKKERGLFFGPKSMVPRWRDVVDLYGMMGWFLYLKKSPPRFDRWTYWEKFDYFAVFWGVPVIGISGLLLWFPEFFSRFLPGSTFNVAMLVHGEEALLATGFIFAFHFFHNHMRPENFPLDTVVFTGKLPLARFMEERPEEYERLVKEGRLDEILAEPPSRRERTLATGFGFAAYIVGLVLVAAILMTFLFAA